MSTLLRGPETSMRGGGVREYGTPMVWAKTGKPGDDDDDDDDVSEGMDGMNVRAWLGLQSL